MKASMKIYVKSDKTFSGETLTTEPYPIKKGYGPYEISKYTTFQQKTRKKHNYILPKNQKTILAKAKQLAKKHSVELVIVDVARQKAVKRLVEKLRGRNVFPIVEDHRGNRLQPPFSLSQLENFVTTCSGSRSDVLL